VRVERILLNFISSFSFETLLVSERHVNEIYMHVSRWSFGETHLLIMHRMIR